MRTKLIFVGLLLCLGCTKSVDFDKWDDVEVDATYITTLIHLDLETTNFLDDSDEEISFLSDLLEIPISDDLEPYIVKIEFTVITRNTFDRNFNLDFVLYDEDNNPIYSIQPSLSVAPSTDFQTHYLEIPASDIGIIYQMTFIGAVIEMEPAQSGEPLNGSEDYEFELKSSMKIFVNY